MMIVGAIIDRPYTRNSLNFVSLRGHKCPRNDMVVVGGALHRRGQLDANSQFSNGMVKVKVVLPSRLVTEISSPWLQTMVLTM